MSNSLSQIIHFVWMSKTIQITNLTFAKASFEDTGTPLVVSSCCSEIYLAAKPKQVLNAQILVLYNKMLKTVQNLQMQNDVF